MTDKRMELKPNQLVLFDDGHKAGITEVCWSSKHNAFCYVSDDTDDEGNRIKHYSATIVEKQQRKKRPFVPCKEKCTVQIFPAYETEKAYAIDDGTNGHTKHIKYYYKYIAKSVCFVDIDGKIYAPSWTL